MQHLTRTRLGRKASSSQEKPHTTKAYNELSRVSPCSYLSLYHWRTSTFGQREITLRLGASRPSCCHPSDPTSSRNSFHIPHNGFWHFEPKRWRFHAALAAFSRRLTSSGIWFLYLSLEPTSICFGASPRGCFDSFPFLFHHLRFELLLGFFILDCCIHRVLHNVVSLGKKHLRWRFLGPRIQSSCDVRPFFRQALCVQASSLRSSQLNKGDNALHDPLTPSLSPPLPLLTRTPASQTITTAAFWAKMSQGL